MSGRQKQLWIALVVFGVVGFLSWNWIQSIREGYEAEKRDAVYVAKAKENIAAGSKLTGAQVTISKRSELVPKAYLPKVAISGTSSQAVQNELQNYVGQEVNVDIKVGDYLLESYFGERKIAAGRLSGLILDNNYRAVSLPVDETNSLARSIEAGDKIDIIFSFQIAGLTQRISTVLLQNVHVISTGAYSVSEREMGGEGERSKRYNSLTLLLPHQDAVRLAYARQNGQVTIMLRRQEDTEMPVYQAITGVEDILPAEERTKIQGMVDKRFAQAAGNADDQKLREQLRQVFEQRRQQQTK